MGSNMNVLSLFDGMSCGQIALNRLKIKYDKYFASEIKKDAIKVTQDNYPNTIQLGDINNIDFNKLPKIDLLIGGSPCQDFSRANKDRKGIDGDKSSLFNKYKEALEILKPKHFLLENVIMDDYGYQYISDTVGTYPVRINSSLVSAQLRDRLYWTNIGDYHHDLLGYKYCDIPQPKDKKIKLSNIIESGYVDRDKSRALLESDSRPLANETRMMHRYIETGMTTIVFEDQKLMKNTNYQRKGWNKYKDNGELVDIKKGSIRYLNQNELEKLQTVPHGYTKTITRNKAASLLGDGWTVDIICHILDFI